MDKNTTVIKDLQNCVATKCTWIKINRIQCFLFICLSILSGCATRKNITSCGLHNHTHHLNNAGCSLNGLGSAKNTHTHSIENNNIIVEGNNKENTPASVGLHQYDFFYEVLKKTNRFFFSYTNYGAYLGSSSAELLGSYTQGLCDPRLVSFSLSCIGAYLGAKLDNICSIKFLQNAPMNEDLDTSSYLARTKALVINSSTTLYLCRWLGSALGGIPGDLAGTFVGCAFDLYPEKKKHNKKDKEQTNTPCKGAH